MATVKYPRTPQFDYKGFVGLVTCRMEANHQLYSQHTENLKT